MNLDGAAGRRRRRYCIECQEHRNGRRQRTVALPPVLFEEGRVGSPPSTFERNLNFDRTSSYCFVIQISQRTKVFAFSPGFPYYYYIYWFRTKSYNLSEIYYIRNTLAPSIITNSIIGEMEATLSLPPPQNKLCSNVPVECCQKIGYCRVETVVEIRQSHKG